MNQNIKSLGEFSLSILEHLLANVVGEDAVKILRDGVLQKTRSGIEQALINTEDRFKKEATDIQMINLLAGLSFYNLSSLQQAVSEFYRSPSGSSLQNLLVTKMEDIAPKNIEKERIQKVARLYLTILREEMISFSPDTPLADKLTALNTESIKVDTQEQTKLLKDIHSLLQITLQLPAILSSPRENYVLNTQSRLGVFYMNPFDKLLNWLDLLTDQEFRTCSFDSLGTKFT